VTVKQQQLILEVHATASLQLIKFSSLLPFLYKKLVANNNSEITHKSVKARKSKKRPLTNVKTGTGQSEHPIKHRAILTGYKLFLD
jgi:hypothetical protein